MELADDTRVIEEEFCNQHGILPPSKRRIRHLRCVIIRNSHLVSKIQPSLDELPDYFFSLHDEINSSLLYVSETRSGLLNPEFSCFNLRGPGCGESSMLLRVYRKSCTSAEWRLLFCVNIPLSSSLYVGDDSLSLNRIDCFAIFVKLDQTFFCIPVPNSLSGADISLLRKRSQPYPQLRSRQSLTFSQVLKIKSLLKSLLDSDSYRHNTFKELNVLLESEMENGFMRRKNLEEHITKLLSELDKRKGELCVTKAEIAEKNEANADKESALEHSLFRRNVKELKDKREQYRNIHSHNDSLKVELQIQRSRIASELGQIFPLKPLESQPFEFGLFDCVIPLSLQIESSKGREISAVLGFVVLATKILSKLLAVPLKYRMEYVGSSSYIVEKVPSHTDPFPTAKILPLSFNRKEWAAFQDALSLLKRNIGILLLSQGLSAADDNNFLGNLKILFLCTVSKGASSRDGIARFDARKSENRIDHIKSHMLEGRARTDQIT